jgi:hypothetical protein
MNIEQVSASLSNSNIAHTLVSAKKTKWIQDVSKEMDESGTKGALHRYFKIPEAETIPLSTLKDALKNPKISEKTRKRIQFALNMRKINKKVTAKAVEKCMVTFRAEESGEFKGQVTAVFPETYGSSEVSPHMVMTYSHMDQHGEASLRWYNATRPAKLEEYADLLKELRGIYEHGKNAVKLVVDQKVNWNKLLLKSHRAK